MNTATTTTATAPATNARVSSFDRVDFDKAIQCLRFQMQYSYTVARVIAYANAAHEHATTPDDRMLIDSIADRRISELAEHTTA
ncbi:MAG: hypothetical protein LPH21_15795 [Shewanella sp.]|nr:hypothetical protein [Shewanella sp.]